MLTDAFLRKIEPPQKGQASYADTGGVPGFSIRVSQGGTKTFVLVHGRQRTRTTLGRYPIISLSQARARAKEILAEITLGTYQTQKGLTFQEALDLFKLHYLPQNRESTARETTRLCTKAALRFASLEINAITTPQIAAFLDKSTDPRGYHQHLSTFFNWCVRRGYIEQNPFSRLQKGRNTPRDRMLNPQELRSTILACSTFGRYGQLLKFLIYTGQRKAKRTRSRKST